MSKGLKITLGLVAGIIIFAGAFSGGFIAGTIFDKRDLNCFNGNPPQVTESRSEADNLQSVTSTPLVYEGKDLQKLFEPFWSTWEKVHSMYVDQPVDDVKLMRGAIAGMLDSLGDPHTSYIDPELLKQTNMSMEGEYEGIGAWVDTTGEFLTIISPMPGSPAEKAGVKAGDQVVAINGEAMTGKDGDYALTKVLGKAGTDVTLSIQRKDIADPFDITITRSKINVPSVTGKMLDNKIGYVQIVTFGEKTAPELKKALKDLRDQDMRALIIDLRNNGGGLLTSAVDVGSQFNKSGVFMYEVYGNGEEKEYKFRPGGLATDIPLIVLVNEGSASASEIVAGAIQDTGRGKLVGVTTYGKGSVQNWAELENNQGAVRITIARWITPNKRQINEVGLAPDYEVQITEADISAGKDPQLEKAIELLK